MVGKVKHLANNERYRILIIEGEAYIMDIEQSFWKIVFPFLFWLLPNSVFQLGDQALVERLQTEEAQKVGVSGRVSIIGTAYAGGVFLSPLMDYFNVSMPLSVIIGLLTFSVILVGLLYFTLSSNRKKKLSNIVKLEKYPKYKIHLKPASIKQILDVLFSYLFLLGISVFFFIGYIETQNVMVLIIASGAMLGFLLVNRKAVREGVTDVEIR